METRGRGGKRLDNTRARTGRVICENVPRSDLVRRLLRQALEAEKQRADEQR